MSFTVSLDAEDLLSRARPAGYEPAALDAVALVVGMGALGQNVALNLALSGVREQRVVDADRFEPHNRTRSPLFPTQRAAGGAGMPKAPSTASALRRHCTHADAVVRWADAWIEALGAAAFDDVDVVVSCVDVLHGRAYLADQCRLLGIPLVEGGFRGAEVTFSTFPAASDQTSAKDLACWRCWKAIDDDIVSCRMHATRAEDAGIVPAIQTAAATLGGMQAEAVIEVLHGHCDVARRTWLNIRTGASTSALLVADPDCSGAHRLHPPAIDAGVGSDAPLSELLAVAAAHLDGEPALQLPFPYVDAGVCKRCRQVIIVRGAGHHYRREPVCTGCGGPWARAGGETFDLNPISCIRTDDDLATARAGSVGLAPGDQVLVSDTSRDVVLRLAGDGIDMFEAA
jgi:molybdopterin/thiamine biosynthesis adenylyltransferase